MTRELKNALSQLDRLRATPLTAQQACILADAREWVREAQAQAQAKANAEAQSLQRFYASRLGVPFKESARPANDFFANNTFAQHMAAHAENVRKAVQALSNIQLPKFELPPLPAPAAKRLAEKLEKCNSQKTCVISWVSCNPVERIEPDVVDCAQALIDVLDGYPKQLVPINRESVTVKALRRAISATQSHQAEPRTGYVP